MVDTIVDTDHKGGMSSERGVLTAAYGAPRYVEMAKMLAKSLLLHSPNIMRAIITDATDDDLGNLFDIIIPVDSSRGRKLRQKVYLNDYSPFDTTLFIDCDCLVVEDITDLWAFFRYVDFGAVGGQGNEHPFIDCPALLPCSLRQKLYPVFNGGLYYFTKSPVATAVFRDAREIMGHYYEWGLKAMDGDINEEPALAISMAKHGIEPLQDNGRAMRTPVYISGPLRVDVLRGYCSFITTDMTSDSNDGQQVHPKILHFCGGWSTSAVYRRECTKLRFGSTKHRGNTVRSFVINGVYGTLELGKLFTRAGAGVRRRLARVFYR